MTLHTACSKQHTLVQVVADYWVCECPAVFRRQGKMWLDPARKGLLDDVVGMMPVEDIRTAARALEHNEQEKKKERKTSDRSRKR